MIPGDFDFRIRPPGDPLDRFVSAVWYARGRVPHGRERILPSPGAVLLVVLGAPLRMTEPGETHVVGAVFQPGGIGAFIDGPIDAIANRILPMDELAPSIVAPGTLSAETDPAAKTPLEAFGGLTIGEWETEDSRHVLKWGVARKVVRSTSYFKVEGEWTLVSEGMWFWDAREQQIRGIAVATGMPVELFEYPLCAITGTRGIHAASR